MKFNIGEVTYTDTTVVIVLTVETTDKTRTIGFVVDAVSDVLNVDKSEIKPAPAFGGYVPQNYLEGLVNAGDNVVTILNVKALQAVEPHQLS